MIKRAFGILIVTVLILLPSISLSQQSVEIINENIDGYFNVCGENFLIPNYSVIIPIKITNINGTSCAYDPTFTFRIYTPDGGQWPGLSLDTLVGTATLFDQISRWPGVLTGPVVDTLGISLQAGTKTGLFDGYEDNLLVLSFQTSMSGTICIDTVTANSSFDWS